MNPDGNPDDVLRIWPLRFEEPALERQFRLNDWKGLLPFHRISYLTGALLYVLFSILDTILAPSDLRELWLIRFGVGLPALLIGFGLTFIKKVQPYVQTIGFFVAGTATLCIVAMIAVMSPPASHLYYAGVVLCVYYSFTFAHVRFANALLFGLTILVPYEIVALAIARTPLPLIINSSFFLVSSILAGMFACYTMERYRRQKFLNLRTINLEREMLEELSAKLEDLSIHDPLTGLFNRRQLSEHLHDAVDRHRGHGTPASVMLIDLDDFKAVNDRLGHLAGDELLKKTATFILESLRKTDRAYRYGGDEFLVLLSNTSLSDARVLADRLVRRYSLHLHETTHFATICGISVGVASLNNTTRSSDALLFAADRALYTAKQHGKGRVMAGSSS